MLGDDNNQFLEL